jgi:hypothetical protein
MAGRALPLPPEDLLTHLNADATQFDTRATLDTGQIGHHFADPHEGADQDENEESNLKHIAHPLAFPTTADPQSVVA